MSKLRVFYVWDENLILQSDRLPAVKGRASQVHSLITAYKLLDHVKVVRSKPATYEDLRKFHSESYLDHLKTFSDIADDDYMSNTLDEEYGIGYDSPPVSNMFELVSAVAGGSITAANSLILGMADVAINWCGGWHHAESSAAQGFCYVNDIVLAIEQLRRKFPKVLYIDLDFHHGDGVENAYSLCKSVFTLSFHKFEPGFYPGTGDVDDIGSETALGYSCNVPLQAGYTNDTLAYAFDRVFSKTFELFKPDAIVVQCGADALAGDGDANLTIDGYQSCLSRVLDKRKPTMLLGGGGYILPNPARLWASLTALVCGQVLDENIPEHSYWPKYRPGYMLAVEPELIRDKNKRGDLENTVTRIMSNLEKYLVSNEPEAKRQKTVPAKLENIKPQVPTDPKKDIYTFTDSE